MSEPDKNLRPLVGLGAMIWKDGKILLGKRKNAHGAGEYCFPGGHLEYMESLEESICRETREEAGIEIGNVRFLRLYNMKEYKPRHYVNIIFQADWVSGKPKTLEPEKFESWGWYDLEKLPSPLFAPIKTALDSHKTGKVFYDA